MFKLLFKLDKLLFFRLITVLVLILILPQFTRAETPPSLVCESDLSKSLTSIIKRSQLSQARLGISLQTLSDGHSLLDLDSTSFFTPASNAKLLTTAAALHLFGPNFTFTTSFLFNGSNLLVVGGGDPSLTRQQLESVAEELKGKGIKNLEHLQVLTSSKSRDSYSSWEWGDLVFDYAAFPSSLNLNQNTFTLTLTPTHLGQLVELSFSDPLANFWQINNLVQTGTESSEIKITPQLFSNTIYLNGSLDIAASPVSLDLSIPKIEEYFLQAFTEVLKTAGISVTQAEKIPSVPRDYQKIIEIKSPPLSELIKTINQNSNNFYAEALLNALEEGTETIKKALGELGIEGFYLIDGSGLSRQNLITPQALVQTLRVMNQGRDAKIYRDSLPVAGESGTLINRLKDTIVQGNLQAKTGTLTGVSSLSGYLNPPNYPPLVLSILINQSPLQSADLRQVIDEIVLLFSQLKSC